MKAQFKAVGRINGADGASVTIDRDRGIVSVRPKREQRTYDLPLLTVAEMVVCRVVKNELASQERKAS